MERHKIYSKYKKHSAELPKTLTVNDTTISNPMEISDIFNNYFSSFASKTKLNVSFSHKHFQIFLKIDVILPFL